MMRDDRAYERALAAKRGSSPLPPVYAALADRVAERYGPRPLWIEADTIPQPGSPGEVRPRLDVVLERTAQFRLFESARYAFDRAKQARIAADFEELVDVPARRQLFGCRRGQELAGDLFVCFSDFESAALEQVHLAVPMDQIDAMGSRLLGDAFWQASRLWGPPVLFVHTDEQVDHFKAQPVMAEADDAYRSLAASHDEFGYLDPAAIHVSLDSKQNFDNVYESNWYYYWK